MDNLASLITKAAILGNENLYHTGRGTRNMTLPQRKKAIIRAACMQLLTKKMTTHRIPHQHILDGTQTQTPTNIGVTTMAGTTATNQRTTGMTATHDKHTMVLHHLGLRVHQGHPVRVQ